MSLVSEFSAYRIWTQGTFIALPKPSLLLLFFYFLTSTQIQYNSLHIYVPLKEFAQLTGSWEAWNNAVEREENHSRPPHQPLRGALLDSSVFFRFLNHAVLLVYLNKISVPIFSVHKELLHISSNRGRFWCRKREMLLTNWNFVVRCLINTLRFSSIG